MDKFRLLQDFAVLAAERSLDIEYFRVYLLLLATSGDEGEGTLHPLTAEKALMRTLTPEDLKKTGLLLEGMGVIKVISLPEPGVRSALRYRLLPISLKA